ncbi:MAG TPA: hypothetical protein VL418_06650 [Devosiaceae bacterium]|jgi:hypothetical protein|nr:hypothetical protein [Devosiaceae bacterium]
MRTLLFAALSGAMVLSVIGAATAQQGVPGRPPGFARIIQQFHSPASVDEELARLAKDLKLSPTQQKQTRVLLLKHQSEIQALLDKNPTASRQALGPEIHAISDKTHQAIHALLTKSQRQLEQQMVQRLNDGQESRRPV